VRTKNIWCGCAVQVSDGQFPAVTRKFVIDVEPKLLSFASSSSTLTVVQGDRLVILNSDCLPLVANGRRETVTYRVTRAPSRGQLLRRGIGAAEEFTQHQVGALLMN